MSEDRLALIEAAMRGVRDEVRREVSERLEQGAHIAGAEAGHVVVNSRGPHGELQRRVIDTYALRPTKGDPATESTAPALTSAARRAARGTY